jgi:hypothetical protein
MNKSVSLVKKALNRLVLLLSTLMFTMYSFAQDTKAVDVNINSKSDNGFFTNPIVWVVGGAIFILLLVALLRSNNRNA